MKDGVSPQSHILGFHTREARMKNEAKGFPDQLRGPPTGHFGDHSGICSNTAPAARAMGGRATYALLGKTDLSTTSAKQTKTM